jgi:hypothetical protein
MLESSYPPEVETDEDMSGTIGQALDRIVCETSRAPVFNKKLVFPRESVRVSELEEKQKELERAKLEQEAARQKSEDDKVSNPTEFKDLDLSYDEQVSEPNVNEVPVVGKPASTSPFANSVSQSKPQGIDQPKPVVVPQASVLSTNQPQGTTSNTSQTQPAFPKTTPVPQPKPSPERVAVEQKAEISPAPSKPVAPMPQAAAKEDKVPVREVVAYRRQAPVRRRVIREVERVSEIRKPMEPDEDLEIFMREAEKVETREIQCRPEVLQLLDEIAEKTGCSPEDLASQAVAGVAAAIKDAGYQFDLPMKVRSVRR